MATPHPAGPQPASPQPDTGLPPGVEVGGLGPRFAAYLIDALPPVVLGVILSLVVPNTSAGVQIIVGIVLLVAIFGWVLFVLQGIAVRAASPGMRIMKLQLVGFYDGRPIGWGRALIRAVVFGLIQSTVVVLVVMIVLMVMHPRRQGWHDLVGQAVMIKERSLPTIAPDQASLAGQSDQGSGQLDALFPPSGSAPQQGYPAGPPLSPPPLSPPPLSPPPPIQSPVAGGPLPPLSYAPDARYSPPAASPLSAPPSSAPSAPPRPGPAPQAVPQAVSAQQRSSGAAPSAPSSAPVARWLAVLDDGREIVVDGLVLLGRNPQPQPGEEDAQLIKLADETRTVSKSHLAVGLDAAGLFVVDRGSTNGSTVTTPSGISTRCQPSQVIYVEPGSIVSIGDHWLEIRKS